MSRQTPKRPTYTFVNGTTVELERVGPLFALPILQAHPTPTPPLAPGVGGQLEPNPADPDYERILEEHQQKISLLMNDVLLDMGIAENTVIDLKAVERVRRIYKKAGIDLSDDDRMVYLKYVCVGSEDDLQGVIGAIQAYDQPSEAQIEAATAMFPADGTGPADRTGDSVPAEEWAPV